MLYIYPDLKAGKRYQKFFETEGWNVQGRTPEKRIRSRSLDGIDLLVVHVPMTPVDGVMHAKDARKIERFRRYGSIIYLSDEPIATKRQWWDECGIIETYRAQKTPRNNKALVSLIGFLHTTCD